MEAPVATVQTTLVANAALGSSRKERHEAVSVSASAHDAKRKTCQFLSVKPWICSSRFMTWKGAISWLAS
eukprot:CAMPEP_0179350366 /NCGR_PEP_ID=MMETSP0797-20121207/74719_1 /TAXON_ID=47934 /ORGANISM="Dinophysis acuminata, Strain DAEP01" /LENGTH=69 /DNA_ID=CAMNT_0021065277 /DNA_START=32 /DNA_END=237 /DNA_ORIENTATION=+